MRTQTFKKSVLAILAIVIGFASRQAVTSISHLSPLDREVKRVAVLIADQTPPKNKNRDSIISLSKHIVTLSHHYDLDPLLVLAIIKVESGFKTHAKSNKGAVGLMQVMPILLREVGKDLSISKREELYDPHKNLNIGVSYLTFLLDKYDNNMNKALAAYNMGPTALSALLSQKRPVPSSYFKKVMSWHKTFQERLDNFPIDPIKLT